MLEGLQQLFESSPLEASATLALYFLLYVLLGLLPVCGAIYLVYFLLTLPLRRNQRARSFLDLVDLGLKEGRTPEATIIDASASHDRSLGVRFHLLAVHLESGMRLSVALERVPRLLPPQIIAMLKTGERIGDVAKVLPACRQALKGGVSQVRGAINYIILLAFVLTPFSLFVPIFLRIKIIPAYRDVFQGLLEGAALPAFTRFILGEYSVFAIIQIAIVAFVWLAMLAYVGGPRLRAWIGSALPGMPDAVLSRLPWRQKRLERDFSAMLAVLLDAQVPETEAVSLAAESTANMTVARRAEKVRALLKDGVKLPEAIAAIDNSGEFRWRLSNALQRGSGFLRALAGWHEALDAKAFQLEQTAAQLTTTGLVLVNGAIVGCIATAIFLALIQLLNQAVLW